MLEVDVYWWEDIAQQNSPQGAVPGPRAETRDVVTLRPHPPDLWSPEPDTRLSPAETAADRIHHLERALANRTTIGQAIGIVMERFDLTPDEAFDRLRVASNTSNRRLVELSIEIVRGRAEGMPAVLQARQSRRFDVLGRTTQED